jgi:hypothetical protein
MIYIHMYLFSYYHYHHSTEFVYCAIKHCYKLLADIFPITGSRLCSEGPIRPVQAVIGRDHVRRLIGCLDLVPLYIHSWWIVQQYVHMYCTIHNVQICLCFLVTQVRIRKAIDFMEQFSKHCVVYQIIKKPYQDCSILQANRKSTVVKHSEE